MMVKIILPASEIPLGETVTKATGASTFVLRDKIVIYGDSAPKQEILAGDGCFFLVGEQGSITAIPGTKELAWRVDEPRLSQWLFERESHQ